MRRLLVLIFILGSFALQGQYYNGFITSDFSGVLSARLNPAAIANSPFKYDINLINGNAYLANNIGYFERYKEGIGIKRYDDLNQRFIYGDQRLGGMSFLLSLPNRSSFALQYQARGVTSGINITPEFIQQFGRFQSIDFVGSSVTNQSGEAATSFWHEIGLTYAFLLSENSYSRWKAGVTLKLINPVASTVSRLQNISYDIDQAGNAMITSMQGQLGYSSNLNEYEFFDGNQSFTFPAAIGFKTAMDVGFTYESVLYRDDPKTKGLTSQYADILYEHRLSISLTDIGKMSFDYGSASFDVLDILPMNDPIDFDTLVSGFTSVREFRDSLSQVANVVDLTGTYSVSMPTALNISYDYNWRDNWFFNVAGQFDVSKLMNADYRLKYANSITLTPRYDTGMSGLYFPIYINLEGDVEAGAAVRYGPFTLGTHSLGSLLSSKKKSLGAFFSISLRQLKANSKKPYCFGKSRTGTALTRTKRKPLYKRKSIF